MRLFFCLLNRIFNKKLVKIVNRGLHFVVLVNYELTYKLIFKLNVGTYMLLPTI